MRRVAAATSLVFVLAASSAFAQAASQPPAGQAPAAALIRPSVPLLPGCFLAAPGSLCSVRAGSAEPRRAAPPYDLRSTVT